MERQFNEELLVFWTNDTETTGHGDGKKVKLTPSVHVTKKLTLSGSRT